MESSNEKENWNWEFWPSLSSERLSLFMGSLAVLSSGSAQLLMLTDHQNEMSYRVAYGRWGPRWPG